MLEAWPPEGLLSQEMWLGPRSWGPAEVDGSSLLHQAEPVSHIRPDLVQTCADKYGFSVFEVTPRRDIVVERKELN